MFGNKRKQTEDSYDTEGISKELALDIYDNHVGFSILVNATETEVIVPERFKNETKLVLNVTRATTKSISFNEDCLRCVLSFSNESFDCTIPYTHIRGIKPIIGEEKSFWTQRQNKQELYKKLFEGVGWIYGIVVILCAVSIYTSGSTIFGYELFQVTRSFWNNESTQFLHKLFAIAFAMFEFYYVIIISTFAPVVLVSTKLNLSTFWMEILFLVYWSIIGLWVFLYNLLSPEKQKEPSIMELNLELLGLRPIFKKKKFNVKNDFCFYVGPFSDEYSEIYNNNIRKPILESGLKIQRADEIFGTLPVMDDIWNVLNECSILIAELSGRNPNVMYEIGMAHTVGKKVIIITQNNADIPFDLRHHRCLLYDNTEEGKASLQEKLVATIRYELGLEPIHKSQSHN